MSHPGLPPVTFDPEVDASSYELFRRLREGRPPALYRLRHGARPEGGSGAPPTTLRGAGTLSPAELEAGWAPLPGQEAILFDDDGTRARPAVLALRRRGVTGVRALFGGLRLYDYALDPRVVGDERYLEEGPADSADD